jgi:LysM repeat protein
MTTFGRVVVAVGVAGVLVAGVLITMHYMAKPEAVPPLPKPPTIIETPSPSPGTPAAPGLATPGPGMAPVSAGPGDSAADEGLAMMRDRPVQAQKRLSEALRTGVDGAKGKEVRDALAALADKVQLSTQRLPDDPYEKTYQAASGDSLIGIGKRNLIPFELIMRINRMGAPSITAGQQIKVIQGPVHVEMLKGKKELQAWLGDVCLRVYPIAIGANNKTPDGTFVVKNKEKNPPYQPQHKTKADFKARGAPDNPLGSRWIDIGNHYGIHGTIDPTSIGRDVSEGCIRMHNKDVEELFDMVVVGASKVTIKP